MDSKLSAAQADLHRDRDVALLASKNWVGAEEALSRLAHVSSDSRPHPAGSDFSAGPRVTEPPLDAVLGAEDLNDDPAPTGRPLLGGRALRSFGRFVATVCIGVAATLVWQSYGSTARQAIVSLAPQLGWLLSPLAMDQPSGTEDAAGQPSLPAAQAAAPQAAPAAAVAPAASETTAPTVPSAESQQLETIAHDLAAVRQSVEQLATGQQQMARDITRLQTAAAKPPTAATKPPTATAKPPMAGAKPPTAGAKPPTVEQDIRRRTSAAPPPAAVAARRPIPPPQQLDPQSSALPPSTELPEPPSRPPMPVR
jgi:hypothetical protein